MTSYSLPMRSKVLPLAAIVASAIRAMGYAGPASAEPLSPDTKTNATSNGPLPDRTPPAQAATGEDTMARCQQLFGLLSRHNSDGYARPLDARMAMEDCQKGKYASGVATLKRSLERAQIPVPSADTATAQTPAPATLRPHGEKRRQAQ